TGSVKSILESGKMRLLPLNGTDLLLQGTRDPRLSPGLIPNTVYETGHDIETIQTMAQFLVMSSMDNDTVYAITQAIWRQCSMEQFRRAHSVAELMDVGAALRDATVPLHPGARRYYEEVGLLEPSRDTLSPAISYP
ncbi:MAG: TAXI family TRAP transporter solute-binding subunit, partial [Pseudomonadota bacterium]